MFGLEEMVATLKSARTATNACLQQLGDDPRNAMTDALYGAFLTEIDALVVLARFTPRAKQPITTEVVEENFPAILGEEFVRRVGDLENLGSPLVDMLAQTADVHKKRAEKLYEEQKKGDAGLAVSLDRNLALVNYRAQVTAASALRRFACGLQDLFFPIGEALLATKLHLMTCAEASAV